MSDELTILWTNPDPITAEKMVFMYARNSMLRGWWSGVTLVIWGATAKLVAESKGIQEEITILQNVGVHVSACIACAEQLGVKDTLESLGIEVKGWGQPLTELLQQDAKILTV